MRKVDFCRKIWYNKSKFFERRKKKKREVVDLSLLCKKKGRFEYDTYMGHLRCGSFALLAFGNSAQRRVVFFAEGKESAHADRYSGDPLLYGDRCDPLQSFDVGKPLGVSSSPSLLALGTFAAHRGADAEGDPLQSAPAVVLGCVCCAHSQLFDGGDGDPWMALLLLLFSAPFGVRHPDPAL